MVMSRSALVIRASTVDLSLVVTASVEELDMGSAWDYFDVMSHTENNSVSQGRRNRLLLRSVLHKHGLIITRPSGGTLPFETNPSLRPIDHPVK